MKTLLMILTALVILVTACGPLPENITIDLGEPTADVSQIVQLTFQAMTQQAPGKKPQPSATPQPPTQAAPTASTGSIAGGLTYPAEGIPALRVVAFNTGTNQYSYIDTQTNQSAYQLDGLGPGQYHIVAYPLTQNSYPTGIYAAYTQFGLCGMHQACNDASLVNVTVQAGQLTSGIDLVDWSVAPEAIPSMPGQQPAANTPAVAPVGSIAGSLSYPAEAVPAMAIIAYHVGGSPNDYYHMVTQQGQTTYQIDNLPGGVYQVVAYTMGGNGFPAGLAGGHTQATLCGYQVNCLDHTLINVTVTAGAVTPNINPGDFYAPPGAFPAYPLP